MISVGDMINKTVDLDDFESQGKISVKYGLDTQLDCLRRQYDGLGSFLEEVIKKVITGLPERAARFVQSCVFLPQLGFLIVVEIDANTGNGKFEGCGDTANEWELVFRTDEAVCYKNADMRHLDDQFGDIYCEVGGEYILSTVFILLR